MPESVHAERVREEEIYQGIRITLNAMLGNARIPLQVDVGFGDVVTPEAVEAELPASLKLPAPRLRVRLSHVDEGRRLIVLEGDADLGV